MKRIIKIEENQYPPSTRLLSVTYPSNAIPGWLAGIQPIVESEAFTSMMISMGNKLFYIITIEEEEKNAAAKASEQVYNIFTGDVTLMAQVAGMALDTPVITEQPYVSVFNMTEKELEEYADAMRVNALAEMEEEETK